MRYDLIARSYPSRSRKKKRKGDFRNVRIVFTGGVFFLISVLYLWRAVELSVFSVELKQKVNEQCRTVINIKGKRGEILARDGRVIAKDIPSYSIWMNPRSIRKDKSKIEGTIKIARILGISQEDLDEKLKKNSYFVWLKRKLSEEELKDVLSVAKSYGLTRSDIGYIKEWKRFFPYGEVLAHVVGFTNIDSQGMAGIELYYDDLLKGEEISVSFLRDALGNIIMKSPPQEPRPGNRVETTLDIDIQINLYKELKNQVEKMRAKGAFAVAMDPKTGEILAAVSLPSFEPSKYHVFANTKRLNAQFYQSVFEPGSVFKIFTISIALEEGLISENDMFFCHNGRWTYKTITIEDVKEIGYATLEEVFAKSSNICAAQIALLTGKEKIYRYLDRLGFGKKTGVDLPGEEKGILHHYKTWYDVDLAVIGFGYFISVNAIQILRAFSVFANGGYLPKPYVVRRVISPYGELVKENKPEFSDRIFSPATIETMKKLMRAVVVRGTGRLAEVPLFLSAGKTGTARKIQGGKYVKEYISNFIGFAPFDEPKIVLFVVFDEPEKRYYGGEVAAPVFTKVVESYLSSNYSWMSEENTHLNEKIHQGAESLLASPVSYPFPSSLPSESRLTLSEFLDSLPEEKSAKNIVIKGYGFVRKVQEDEREITVFLSP